MKFERSITSSSQTGAHQGKHGGDHVAGSRGHFSNRESPPDTTAFGLSGLSACLSACLSAWQVRGGLEIPLCNCQIVYKNKQISVRKHSVEISPMSTH